jgi:hypothetical protein
LVKGITKSYTTTTSTASISVESRGEEYSLAKRRRRNYLATTSLHNIGPLRQTRFIKHDIVATDPKPFRLPPYQYSTAKKRPYKNWSKRCWQAALSRLRHCQTHCPSSWLPKRTGSSIFASIRRLNRITEDSAQLLPVIHELLKDLVEATIFPTLNSNGDWQILLTDRAKKYAAFVIPDGGKYVFKVTLFGLQGAERTCTQLFGQEVLQGDDTDRRIVSYASAKFTPAETKST